MASLERIKRATAAAEVAARDALGAIPEGSSTAERLNDAADRLAKAAVQLRTETRLVVLVKRPWFTKSAWDSYTKWFADLDGKTAEERLLDWWLELPDDSFTKTEAIVQVLSVQERHDLLSPASPLWLASNP